jgi:16S rRNA (guanine527-N7)-methyltransferase
MAKPTKSGELLESPIRGPEDFAAAFGASRETLVRLATYEQLLRQWQKTINLVAPSTLDAIWHRHFADSAQLLPLAPKAATWVDLGSGAGFPGLVVAILLASPPPPCGEGLGVGGATTANVLQSPPPYPSPTRGEGTTIPRITLIESNARKCAFLREVARQTGIAARVTVDILSTRIEVAATQASLQGPDVVCARALAPLDRLLNLAAPLSSPRTVGLFLKGRDAATELRVAEKMWDFNAELVPSRTDRNARIVVIRHLQPKAQAKE